MAADAPEEHRPFHVTATEISAVVLGLGMLAGMLDKTAGIPGVPAAPMNAEEVRALAARLDAEARTP